MQVRAAAMAVETLNAEQFLGLLGRVQQALEREKQRLSQLDSHIGDGDHGFGMANGFRIGFEKASQDGAGSIEAQLKTLGLSLIREVGGASGTIFGTVFLAMAKIAKDRPSVGLKELSEMFAESLAQVQQRGKAQPGDKTMVDALGPAAESLRQSAEQSIALAEAVRRAAQAALAGAEATKNMIGKHGRAKYFKEKSIGFQDAGATTVSVILATLAEGIEELEASAQAT
jgi:dihydroxyacetone kinase-like protein